MSPLPLSPTSEFVRIAIAYLDSLTDYREQLSPRYALTKSDDFILLDPSSPTWRQINLFVSYVESALRRFFKCSKA